MRDSVRETCEFCDDNKGFYSTIIILLPKVKQTKSGSSRFFN